MQMTIDLTDRLVRPRPGRDWNSLAWDKIRQQVRRLQMRIARQSEKPPRQKRELAMATHHRVRPNFLAVKRVTENKGQPHTGDRQKCGAPTARNSKRSTNLIRRGYIHNRCGPLHQKERQIKAAQFPTLLGSRPTSPAPAGSGTGSKNAADRNSYGFREGRCCADAIGHASLRWPRVTRRLILEAH